MRDVVRLFQRRDNEKVLSVFDTGLGSSNKTAPRAAIHSVKYKYDPLITHSLYSVVALAG